LATRTLSPFLHWLTAPALPGTFNPWRDHDPATDRSPRAAAERLARLCAHLSTRPAWLLVGEAAGYQGCKVSGIPFTSERLLLEGRIPRIAAPRQRLSTRERPWSEPSATTVWGTLHALGVAHATLLWNAFPFHPHQRGDLHSNRTPTRDERAFGLAVLAALLRAFPRARPIAVGRQAEAAFAELGMAVPTVRHPSMGGAAEFRRGMARLMG